jgi:tetratricopeptide (TPR) repeat protein
LEAAKALRDGGDLSGPALERGLQAIGAAEANRLAREDPARGWLKAAEAFERAMALAPGSALLSQSARMASQNQETAFHNSFAAAYNAGRYEEAASLLREALALMPQSARLRSDLEAAERMIGR